MSFAVRQIRRDEVYAFRAAVMRVFGADADAGDEDERFLRLMDIGRVFGAFDGDDIVGTTAAFTFEVTVPGAVVPMGGLTMVTVQPSHRRKGVLRAMMAAHLEDVRRRGEPLSGLWASETSIYGRFGYGAATETEAITIDRRGVALDQARGHDAVRIVDGEALLELLPGIYERVRPNRPGVLSRTEAWWRQRTLRETPDVRGRGTSKLRAAVCWRGDAPTGYALYRQRPGFEDNLPAGKLDLVELLAVDGEAETTLWRFLCSVDLFPTVSWWNAPSDLLLPWVVRDRRRVQRRRLDNLWLRPCDVGRALSARRYALDGELVIEVADSQDEANVGVYLLRVEGGRGTCERTQRPPQLRTDAAGLGAMYMGAHRPSLLARAGRLAAADRGTLGLADALFSWPTAAWCPEVF